MDPLAIVLMLACGAVVAFAFVSFFKHARKRRQEVEDAGGPGGHLDL